ncbi:MAG TPA: hypothetical protein ENK22_09135 [Persephonella sp.]|nr:hypothetical protein [Persephonella sp.]
MSENKLPQIPKEWKWVRLEKIGEIVTGTTPSKKNKEYYGKEIPFFKPPDLESGRFVTKSQEYLSKKGLEVARLLPKNSILVTCIGATIGKTGIIKVNGTSNQQINAIIPYEDYIIPEYIYYQIISPFFQEQIKKNATATTLPILNKSKFEKLFFSLAPLPEQQKIIEILEEAFSKIDAGVEGLKKIKKLLSLYRQSVLRYAFEGKLTQKWREENKDKLEPAEKLIEKIKKEREERYKQELEEWKKACEIAKKEGKKKPPKPKPPKEFPPITEEELKTLPQIPKEWKWVRLGELINIFDSMRIPLNQQERNLRKKKRPLYPYYGATGKIDEIDEYIFDGEYVLLGEDGVQFFDKGKRKAYIVRGKFWANNHVHILKAVNGIKNLYLMHYFNIFDYHGYVTGTTRLKLNQSAMKNIPIPLSPFLEQQKIVEEIEYRLSIADKLEETVDKLLEKAEKLKQSYLKSAFEGKLTEEWRKQNPHLITGENSVDILLEKIKEEKEKFEEKKKITKVKQKSLIELKQ